MTNWIDRRAARDRNRGRAPELWQQAITAIQDACHSFAKEYPESALVETVPQNGHRLFVVIKFGRRADGSTNAQPQFERNVAIQFNNGDKPFVSVTVDDGTAVSYPIEADEGNCYITLRGKRLTPDEFSESVLENPLFRDLKPKHPRPTSGGSFGTAWS